MTPPVKLGTHGVTTSTPYTVYKEHPIQEAKEINYP
jgi:hypothetical protein